MWFSRKGIFVVPSSIIGWVLFAGVLVYAVVLFIDIDSRSHSVSDTLMNVGFNYLILGAVYSLIGFLTSKKEQ